MKILVLGGNSIGAYLAGRLLEDTRVKKLYHVGANPSKTKTDRYIPLESAYKTYIEFLNSPEGLDVDLIIPTTITYQKNKKWLRLARELFIPILAPGLNIYTLEWTRIVGKRILKKLDIPTPAFEEYTREELLTKFKSLPRPFVYKYQEQWLSGLQTVIVTDDNVNEEYNIFVDTGVKLQGDPLQKFIVEEFIKGSREYSWHALANATGFEFIGAARDYKKRYDNDIGFNTSSMGAYAPAPVIDEVVKTYADKIVKYFKDVKKYPYIGVLYLGIMVGEDGVPYVLEINTRPGSPEMEVILETIDTNLLDMLYSTAGNLPIPSVVHNDKVAVAIKLSHKEYNPLAKLENPKEPDLSEVPDDIHVILAQSALLQHSIVLTTDTVRTNAAQRLYNYLLPRDTGDYTFRKDIGYLD